MRSRGTVSNVMRRWLAMQQDLGGDEVIFASPLDVLAVIEAADAMAQPAPRPRPAPAAALIPTVAAGPPATVAIGSWRKDAPPIPPAGLTVVTEGFADPQPRWSSLEEIAAAVRICPRCPLCATRTNAVPGEGNARAGLLLVGEGPGETEDRSGRPFVGRAGELLDKMLASIDIARRDVFIANVVKCRPPKNRVPLPDERDACMPYLRRQIALVRPRVLLALGGTATETLLGVKAPLGQLRTRVHRWNGIPLIVTYHPAALLRNPNWKRPAWDDVRIARQLLDRDS